MATALTTIDQLVASIQHSYVAANELILHSSKSSPDPAQSPVEPDVLLQQQAQFIINNALGNPSVAIPLVLFHSPVRYYLDALLFELPCYTMSGSSFFKGLLRSNTTVLHSFVPTQWQTLFYTCRLYHLSIKIDVGQTKLSFRAASNEEVILLTQKMRPSPQRTAWNFILTPEQERQLQVLPQTIARSIYWRSSFIRAWHWLSRKHSTG